MCLIVKPVHLGEQVRMLPLKRCILKPVAMVKVSNTVILNLKEAAVVSVMSLILTVVDVAHIVRVAGEVVVVPAASRVGEVGLVEGVEGVEVVLTRVDIVGRVCVVDEALEVHNMMSILKAVCEVERVREAKGVIQLEVKEVSDIAQKTVDEAKAAEEVGLVNEVG